MLFLTVCVVLITAVPNFYLVTPVPNNVANIQPNIESRQSTNS